MTPERVKNLDEAVVAAAEVLGGLFGARTEVEQQHRHLDALAVLTHPRVSWEELLDERDRILGQWRWVNDERAKDQARVKALESLLREAYRNVKWANQLVGARRNDWLARYRALMGEDA